MRLDRRMRTGSRPSHEVVNALFLLMSLAFANALTCKASNDSLSVRSRCHPGLPEISCSVFCAGETEQADRCRRSGRKRWATTVERAAVRRAVAATGAPRVRRALARVPGVRERAPAKAPVMQAVGRVPPARYPVEIEAITNRNSNRGCAVPSVAGAPGLLTENLSRLAPLGLPWCSASLSL